MSFLSVQGNSSRCKNVVDASRFQADISAGSVPSYVFYMCNDGHDSGIGAAGKFLTSWYNLHMTQASATNGTTVPQVIVDENDSKSPSNAVFSLAIPFTQACTVKKTKLVPGSTISSPYNH